MNKSIRLPDSLMSYIERQTDNFNGWVKDACEQRKNKQEKLHDTMHKLGLYAQKIDATQYLIRTLHKASSAINFDENSHDKGIITFKFSGLVSYSLDFYFHKIYLKHGEDFYQFEYNEHEFYHDFSTDGYFNGDTEIDFSEHIMTKHLTKTINIDNLNNKENYGI